jgi:hypothetical protein
MHDVDFVLKIRRHGADEWIALDPRAGGGGPRVSWKIRPAGETDGRYAA